MSWLIWRQHRHEILGLLVGAILIFGALVYGADYATRIRAELGVIGCQPLGNISTNANCVNLAVAAGERLQPFRWLIVLLFFVPALVGSFVGGPLFARDLERGTHRLVWTQGITRLRWSATKLLALCLSGAVAATIVAAVGGLATTINGSSVNAYQNFDLEGPAFVSYVVFAIAIAAFAGTVSRRILTGMFLGLLLFGVARIGISYGLRPSYEPPVTAIYGDATPCPQCAVGPGGWVVGIDYLDHAGKVVPQGRVRTLSESYRPFPDRPDAVAYLAANDARERVRFQPADRYWRFQWTEGLVFLALSAALALATLWLLRRRDA